VDEFVKATTPHDRRVWFGRWAQWCRTRKALLKDMSKAEENEDEEQSDAAVSCITAALAVMNSEFDGWCALAPFNRVRPGEMPTWLSKAVKYNAPQVTTSRPRRQAAKSKSTDRLFFQQRERDDHAFREWHSSAVHEHLQRNHKPRTKIGFIIVRTEEVGDGLPHENLDSHNESINGITALAFANTAVLMAAQLCSIYLPPAGTYAVRVPTDVSELDCGTCDDADLATQLEYSRLYLGERQLDAISLLDDGCDPSGMMHIPDQDFGVYLFAPHMFVLGSDLEWQFSGPLEGDRGWCVSSYMYRKHSNPKGLICGLLCCALHGAGLSVCENLSCVMNNSDSVDEDLRGSGILCPGCLRMLQLSGALPNVEDALRKLYEFFRRMHASKQGVFRLIDCENELKMLEDWGVEWGVEKEAELGFVAEEAEFEYEP